MRAQRAWVGALVTVACGRIGFDPARDDVGDATSLGFCESLTPAPAFCADFDDGIAIDSNWSGSQTPLASSSFSLDPTARSAPASLRANMGDAAGNCGVAGATAWKDLPGLGWHLTYSILIGDAMGNFTGGAAISFTELYATGVTCKFFFTTASGASPPQLQLQRFDPGYSEMYAPLTSGPVVGTWSRIEVYINAAQLNDPAVIRVLHDGVEVLAPTTFPGCPLPSSAVTVIGPYSCNGAAEARYDNVTIDLL